MRLMKYSLKASAVSLSFAAVLLLLAGASPVQAATLRISAPKVQLELAPGASTTGEITVENPTEEDTRVRIYIEDWVYAAGGTGEKIFSPSGTTARSAAGWITFSPAEEVLKPFGRTTVRYTIQVPPDAKGAHYAVLFFEAILGVAKDEEGVNVLVSGRIGSLFYLEAAGSTVREGRVKEVTLDPPQGNRPLEIKTVFENTGDTDITVGGNFLVMDTDGQIHARGDLNRIYTFPGTTEPGSTQWVGRLSSGAYQVLLTYDLGKGKSLVEEKSLTIP